MNDETADNDARARLQADGVKGLDELFAAYRDRLRGAINLRLDRRLQSRVDPSDVIQETFLEAQDRLDEYLRKEEVAPYVWMRFLTLQKLAMLQRHHLKTKQRDARREVSVDQKNPLMTSSINLAACIMDSRATPGQALQQVEMQANLEAALEQMEPQEREALALRHFEQMSNQEAAQVLNVSTATASRQYYAALRKLQTIFMNLFGDTSGLTP